MPITFSRCLRCSFPIGWNNEVCNKCGKMDNDFCPSCHIYNHKFNPLFKYARDALHDVKEARKDAV